MSDSKQVLYDHRIIKVTKFNITSEIEDFQKKGWETFSVFSDRGQLCLAIRKPKIEDAQLKVVS